MAAISSNKMLKAVVIHSQNANDEELRRLYETAFPEGEQIPYDDLIHLLDVMDIDYTAYYDGEMFVGLTMVLRLPKYNWVWYFAVREELRGKGYGQIIFTSMVNSYRNGNPYIMDIESPFQPDAPNPEQRQRRYAFYLRNGMKDTGTHRTYNNITFTILSTSDEPFTNQDYDDIVAPLRATWDNMPGKQ